MIGRTISHYQIVERIGGGGMGVVYAADDTRLGRQVALKFLPRELSADPQAVERFQREARAASSLNHPHICTIHDIGTTESPEGVQHYIVMEMLDGQNLKRQIDAKPLPIADVLELGIQIADALGAAHAKGIVHRDVKPANVFVTRQGHAKVLDFGLAKLDTVVVAPGADREGAQSPTATMASAEPLTSPGVAVGTIEYMSPEQARGEEVDARTDLYSLGLVLYEMATGQQAFSGRTSALVFDAILHRLPAAPVRLNPQIPVDLERIINRAVEKDRRMRYQTASDLAADLRRVRRQIESGAAATADTSPVEPSRPHASAHKPKRSVRPKSGKAAPVPSTQPMSPMPVETASAESSVNPGAHPSGATARALSSGAGPAADGSVHTVRRFALLSAAALLALAAVAGLSYFIGSRSVPAGIGASGRPSVAVATFESPGGEQETRWLTAGLPGMLVTGLGQTPGLDVVGSQRIDEILKDLGVPEGGRIDPSRVLDVGRRAGAGAMVVGNIFKVGSELRIDVQLQDVASGRVLGAHSVRGADAFALADDLTGRILTSLNVSSADGTRRVAEVTSTSTEAYRLYSEGVRAGRLLRRPEARKLLEAAVAIDDTFAAAWLELGSVAGGLDDRATEARCRQKVIEHIDRLTERQRWLFEASEAARTAQEDQAIELLEKLLARYPDEEKAYSSLASTYDGKGDSAKSIATAERGVKALPRAGSLRNTYGYMLLYNGRYPEALREFEAYADLEPNEPNPYDSQAEVYLIMSQPDRALDRYARVLQIDPSFTNAHLGRTWAFGMMGQFDQALEELVHAEKTLAPQVSPTADLDLLAALVLTRAGRYQEAAKRAARGVADAEKFQDHGSRAHIEFARGLLDIERGNLSGALQAAKRVEDARSQLPPGLAQNWTVPLSLLAGIAEARAGRLDDARATLKRLQSAADTRRSWENWSAGTLEGEILLAAGDLASAERAFASADPPLKMWFSMGGPSTSLTRNSFPFRDGAARVLLARGNVDGAIDAYRRLLTLDLGQKWTAILEPRLVLQLARVLERKSDRAAARQQYERFLDLWKRADADLPELAEARQKVRTLGGAASLKP